ncbi:MAG: hypothetical protein JSR67_03730 [Proteobacteria bacterium]|nr:hypothetical protein [Pseudomonadota bacterium]
MEESNFERWVRQYGVKRLVRDLFRADTRLGVTPHSVYNWLARRHRPHENRLTEILRIAGGSITEMDVREHFGTPLR